MFNVDTAIALSISWYLWVFRVLISSRIYILFIYVVNKYKTIVDTKKRNPNVNMIIQCIDNNNNNNKNNNIIICNSINILERTAKDTHTMTAKRTLSSAIGNRTLLRLHRNRLRRPRLPSERRGNRSSWAHSHWSAESGLGVSVSTQYCNIVIYTRAHLSIVVV